MSLRVSAVERSVVVTLQAFVVIAVYNMTRIKVALVPLIVRLWIETTVAMRRAKVVSTEQYLLTGRAFTR